MMSRFDLVQNEPENRDGWLGTHAALVVMIVLFTFAAGWMVLERIDISSVIHENTAVSSRVAENPVEPGEDVMSEQTPVGYMLIMADEHNGFVRYHNAMVSAMGSTSTNNRWHTNILNNADRMRETSDRVQVISPPAGYEYFHAEWLRMAEVCHVIGDQVRRQQPALHVITSYGMSMDRDECVAEINGMTSWFEDIAHEMTR